MKLTPTTKQTDPRVIPPPLDDESTAERVKTAPTSESAWRTLGLPGDVDYTNELVAAANAVLPVGDSIAKGLVAFGALGKDADVPDGWVDRMVTLYVQELEAFWALDQIAHESSKVHGWTVTTKEPPADDRAGRIAQRARWIAEESRPKAPALWYDRTLRLLADASTHDQYCGFVGDGRDNSAEMVDRCTCGLEARLDTVKIAGRALVHGAVHHRFTHWRATR